MGRERDGMITTYGEGSTKEKREGRREGSGREGEEKRYWKKGRGEKRYWKKEREGEKIWRCEREEKGKERKGRTGEGRIEGSGREGEEKRY